MSKRKFAEILEVFLDEPRFVEFIQDMSLTLKRRKEIPQLKSSIPRDVARLLMLNLDVRDILTLVQVVSGDLNYRNFLVESRSENFWRLLMQRDGLWLDYFNDRYSIVQDAREWDYPAIHEEAPILKFVYFWTRFVISGYQRAVIDDYDKENLVKDYLDEMRRYGIRTERNEYFTVKYHDLNQMAITDNMSYRRIIVPFPANINLKFDDDLSDISSYIWLNMILKHYDEPEADDVFNLIAYFLTRYQNPTQTSKWIRNEIRLKGNVRRRVMDLLLSAPRSMKHPRKPIIVACQVCGTTQNVKTCERCQAEYYCSKKCQQIGWKGCSFT
jgi:hypothetical protein